MCLGNGATNRQAHTTPSGLVVKNASNSRFALSASIPTPPSTTATSTLPLSWICVRIASWRGRVGDVFHDIDGVDDQVDNHLLGLKRDRQERRETLARAPVASAHEDQWPGCGRAVRFRRWLLRVPLVSPPKRHETSLTRQAHVSRHEIRVALVEGGVVTLYAERPR
jgi:hypothetical protein